MCVHKFNLKKEEICRCFVHVCVILEASDGRVTLKWMEEETFDFWRIYKGYFMWIQGKESYFLNFQ